MNFTERPQFVTEIDEELVQVSCGYRHTLFLTENGKVYGCGTNKKYEMGQGNSSMSHMSKFDHLVRISNLEMYMITKIAAGKFSAALT